MHFIATYSSYAGIGSTYSNHITWSSYSDKPIVHAAKINSMHNLNERLWLRLQGSMYQSSLAYSTAVKYEASSHACSNSTSACILLDRRCSILVGRECDVALERYCTYYIPVLLAIH